VNLTVEGGAKAKGEVALADRLLLVGAASVYGSGTVEGKANASATVLGVAADVGVKAVVYGEAAAKAGLKIHDHFGVDVGVQAEGSGEASAKAGVKMGADGIAVKLNASAEASVRANFASNLKLGPVDIQHQFRAYALAKADASLSGSVGLLDGKLELSAKAGAWAGAAVGLEVGRTIKVAGITLDSSAGIYAGKLGGAAGVDASYKGGKLTLGVSFGLAIGVGLNVNFSITIDFVELIEKVENELSKLAANDTDRQNMKNLGAWSRQVGGMPMFMQ
jgi:hypothetical protein